MHLPADGPFGAFLRTQYNPHNFTTQRFQVSFDRMPSGFQEFHSFSLWTSYRLVVRAAVNVKEGENLYTTYTFTTSGTRARQEFLKKGKNFTCKCPRCLDPTELNTHFSSLMCQKCSGGVIISSNPLGKLLSFLV